MFSPLVTCHLRIMTSDPPRILAPLDPEFVPALVWQRAYTAAARAEAASRTVRLGVYRPNGTGWQRELLLLPDQPRYAALNQRACERLLKFLLWAWGGNTVVVEGAPDIAAYLRQCYSPHGARSFDEAFIGQSCFRAPFTVVESSRGLVSGAAVTRRTGGRHLTGCRIGFDLGGSDRKCAALIDGSVVFSEEVKWSPYFQTDPEYHVAGIRDTLRRAAAHLPRVDAIGGSAAGLYIDGEPRVASLFRGLSPADFEREIRPVFRVLQAEWGGIPFEVVNDGDVTALAGSMAIGDNAVLGISMGTSLAAGYIDRSGQITGWLNELAFVPVDYRVAAPADEWSGDLGCGAQYFSQQAVGRLLAPAGLAVAPDMPLPEQLEFLQLQMRAGDTRAAAVYATIGTYLGYAVAHWAGFYDFRHLLVLGRVMSGPGGDLILAQAKRVLAAECPAVAQAVTFQQPDEHTKRHGQAIAAASLPEL
jgi:predicted NBD/HSP70 family sugar kinase